MSTTVILQYLGKDPSADMRVNTATNAHYRLGANNIFTIFAEDLAVFLGMNNENRTLFQRVT
ncbi:MAG TPA: hypothetical protein P5317_07675 [Myxococcota bacterium]|nr:hypothetical protein [Myxococcota bacterium]HRV17875.1 hypothetical protein [Myxococcota bacterium]